MLGQAQTPRRRSLPFAAIALVVLAAPALGLAGSSQSASSLRAQNAQLESRSRSAVLELYSLDQRLAGAQARYAQLEGDATSLQAQRADLTKALIVAQRGNRIAQRQLAARLRLMYEQGDVEPLEIIFGSKNLDEALSNLDNLSRMTAQSEDVLRQIDAAHAALQAASARLAARAGRHRRGAGRSARDRRVADPDAHGPADLRLVARHEAPAERCPDLVAPGPGSAANCAATRSHVP